MQLLQGRVLVRFGDNVSTDDITSAKYVISTVPVELAKICLRDLDPDFLSKMTGGGFLIAGRNFGCGSSREWAPIALKAAGVKAVVAAEFARIFYRNAINVGLPLLEYPDILADTEVGDDLAIDLQAGTIANRISGLVFQGIPLPEFLLARMEMGGLAEYLRSSGARTR